MLTSIRRHVTRVTAGHRFPIETPRRKSVPQRCHATAIIPKAATYLSRVTDPWLNLAFEEWLFRNPELPPHILYLWRNTKCVVVGKNQNAWKECNLRRMQEDGVPLVRRRSGGGTVYHDIGNTNYTIIMPRDVFDRRTNAELVTRALLQLDIPASVNERHDIVVDGKKVSGSAYKLVNTKAYHHGTMLIDSDLKALGTFLKPPPKNLVGKGVESVRSKVTRLRDHSYTIDHLSFCDAVATEFLKYHQVQATHPIELTADYMAKIPKIKEYYDEIRTWEWVNGQTPDFAHRLEHSFPWGDADIHLKVHRGIITEASVNLGADHHAAVALRLSESLENKRYDADGVDEAFGIFDLAEPSSRVLEELAELREWIKRTL
ncbi:putative lipoate-protein ligase A [Fimicolochytrium jonesii]|uniref:putative lipoate-protein ligase A n=1 Tax=Fimicolochytrium jonesii TaxID=1396493 RepID=UPI0022FE201F|nr:putative lipoate-protein ligase A [Fimicolochytrium jonesii]KAI8822582.1 putative lipoate-protein ligase A [Fimicolochytrium jonesii]